MRVSDYYEDSIKYGLFSLTMTIDFLVYEKKMLSMNDDEEKLNYYLQDRFKNKMNEYLAEYKVKWNKERVWSA